MYINVKLKISDNIFQTFWFSDTPTFVLFHLNIRCSCLLLAIHKGRLGGQKAPF